MSRKAFQQGLNKYQVGNYQEALLHFNEALENTGPNSYLILDSRAAVYSKLGETKKAMKDARQTIDIAPDKWQGYARAARLFLQSSKFEASITMIKMALDRLKETEQERRTSLLSLEQQVHRDREAHRKRFADNMGKLPIELFGEIARILMMEDPAASIILSQVSKHWREVVHNIPFLWDSLVLTRRRPKQKAKVWLERSQGRIRELVVRSSALDVPQWSTNLLDPVQWRYLRVLRVQRWDVATFLHSIGHATSLKDLEQLELDYSDNIEAWRARSLPALSNHLHLRNLTMRGMPLSWATHLTNITSLRLQSVTCFSGALSDFLKNNPFLEHLSIETLAVLSDDKNKEDFSLPCLSVLEIKGSYPIFVHTLDFPKLEVLRVDTPPPGYDSFLQHLVTNSTPALTELRLTSVQCRGDSIMNLLRISPNLQILEVSNTASHATTIIEALASPSFSPQTNNIPSSSTTSILCPKLTHVNFSKSPDVQTGPLVRMIKLRLPPMGAPPANLEGNFVSRMTSLVIDECPNVDSNWLPWFREKVGSVSCVYMKKSAKFRS